MIDRLKLWLVATRPVSLTAALVPVLVGTLVAAYDRDLFAPLMAAGLLI